MNHRIWTIVLVPLTIMVGCYDLEDGSVAKVLEATGDATRNGRNSVGTETNRESQLWSDYMLFEDEFYEIKSGDTCGDEFYCGYTEKDPMPDVPSSREVACMFGYTSATDVVAVQEATPRNDKRWTDCTALNEGRSGEACDGEFSCYRESSVPGCIETVACGIDTGFDAFASILTRYMLCDDSLSLNAPSADAVYTSCEGAWAAQPLSACEGGFMCQGELFMEPVSIALKSCGESEGSCWQNDQSRLPSRLIWCDDGKIRSLSTVHSAVLYLLGFDPDTHSLEISE